MTIRPTALERAFALARTGDYPRLNDIQKQLKIEGHDVHQLEGRSLRRQLRAICLAAPRKAEAC